LISDVAVWVINLLCLIFRDQPWMEYASPAACIAYCIYFFITTLIRSKRSVGYLLDKAAPVSDQNEILDLVLSSDRALIEQINDVKTRLVNDELRINLDISFKKEVTYEQEMLYLDSLEKRVVEKCPGAQVQLVHLIKEEVPDEDSKPEKKEEAKS
jgi:divalent metal cation (Fe/Co/Zn/Cd) transporter